MSKEYQQIVALVDHLDHEEVQDLMDHLHLLQDQQHNDTDFYISEKEEKIVNERFRMIDEGKTKMAPWEEVRKRVFKL